jgi:hypothetical protein
MKRFGLMLLVLPLLAKAQTFQPGTAPQTMTAITLTGPTLIPAGSTTPLVVVIGNVLYAVPNAAVGQAAVDACNAGTTIALGGQGGLGPNNCENNRQPAINADIQVRVKAAIAQIPPAALAQYNLNTVQ